MLSSASCMAAWDVGSLTILLFPCRVIHGMDYKLLLIYHDARKSGWTKEEIIPMAQQYSNCSDRL